MATTTNYGWTTPDDTALVKDGAAAIRTLGSSVDTTTKALNPETTLGDIAYRSSTANVNTRLPLGTAGQVLKVNSGGTAPEWATDATGMTNPMTTTGDTIYSSSGSTPARLGIGTTGQVLTVAGGVPTWASAGSGFVGCSLAKSSQSIANNTNTAIAWTSEEYDTDAFHDNVTNNTRITIPTGKSGKYSIEGCVMYVGTNTNSTGTRNAAIYKNGNYLYDITTFAATAAGTSRLSLNFAITLNLTATDYVEIYTDHNAGTSINITGDTKVYVNYEGA